MHTAADSTWLCGQLIVTELWVARTEQASGGSGGGGGSVSNILSSDHSL